MAKVFFACLNSSRRGFLPVSLVAATVCLSVSLQAYADDVTPQVDVVYGKGGDRDLKLDLFRPSQAEGPLPGVLVIHGGGWRGGNKESMHPFALHLAKEGYVTASVQYRLSSTAKFPAQIEDVKCAVRWMRANAAEIGVDPERIGAMGGSAGGHLALMLGLMDPKDGLEGEGGHADFSSQVSAVVNYFGPTDLTLSDWDPGVEPLLLAFLDGPLEKRREAYRRASPVTYLDGDDPPVLTFHGTHDPIVPYGQALLLDTLLREAGVEGSRLIPILGASHGWAGPDLDRTLRETLVFFDRYLKGESVDSAE